MTAKQETHSTAIGYMLWIFGFTGAHRFYFGKRLTGLLWLLTGGLLGIGWLILHLRHKSVEVVHEVHGKASSTLMFALLAWITAGGGPFVVQITCWILAAIIVVSTVDYVRAGLRQF